MSDERNQVWNGGRIRYDRRLKIVTTSYNVVEFERRGTGGISQMLFLFEFTFNCKRVSEMFFSTFKNTERSPLDIF